MDAFAGNNMEYCTVYTLYGETPPKLHIFKRTTFLSRPHFFVTDFNICLSYGHFLCENHPSGRPFFN